ncbi:FA_FANCE domain-containing protein [Cephalotus follicularis]|uniref:FA_FANCE domain-containing protein n=1 Tax=Cephalotus follicularis TaxID=3775 RepID=A0A1Q3BKR1_CEPFO|nr:FA_FANCE domain-containing protein [Cephalotus follicularis]
MESWVPLFDIFLNSPTPETKASLWLKQSFNVTSSSLSSTTTTTTTTTSFLSLLRKPLDATATTKGVMYIQTLPPMLQSRILSFLAFDNKRFCTGDLARLAREILSADQEVDFWVKRAARNLLDVLSVSNYEWIYGLNLDSSEERVDHEEFESVPAWLESAASANNDLVLTWLPLSPDELISRPSFGAFESREDSFSFTEEGLEEDFRELTDKMEVDGAANVTIEAEFLAMAASLRTQVMIFESSAQTVALAGEIRQLCLDKGGDPFAVLGLIEPWKADDETASVLISCLSTGNEDELAWPSQVLCSIVLPKLLVLEEPAPRVLLTSTIEYCKLRQRAAVYALLTPLILRSEGINNPICDVITRIVRECLHPAHASAFCQKLLCRGKDEWRFIILPCHQCLMSAELVWTESLFNLFQNILNHNVTLSQDSIDHLVYRVQQLAERFSNSLKFGNFLLCLITKCAPLLQSHKLFLTEAVHCTNTFVTKSILSKLANF